MHRKITEWLPACLVLTAIASVCVKGTTSGPQGPTAKDTRDVSNINMETIMNDCNETFRTEMSYIESLNDSGSFPDETERTPKCFVRCLLEKSNVLSADGALDSQRASAFFAAQRARASEEDFRDSAAACSSRNETCMCERSYQFIKCVVEMELKKYDMSRAVHCTPGPPTD